jgi:formylglycine-generating enzyme required for sulfatase activity
MATPRMPNYVPGVAAAGVDTLRAIASTFADWQLKTPINTKLADAAALASEYFTKLAYPEHVFSQLPEDAQDRVAIAVGCVARAAWVSPPVPPGTPSYKQPSWEGDVYKVLYEQRKVPAPIARTEPATAVSHARDWRELASLTTWKKARNRAAVTKSLAKALGASWKPIAPAGEHALPRLQSTKLGVTLVAIPGGTLQMGLSPAEQRDLTRRVKGRGPEAAAHVRELGRLARPVHAVEVDAFLCAETPVLARHARKLGCDGDAANAHAVVRMDSETAAAVVTRSKLRLLAEAEWEWVARAAGKHAWLSGDDEPEVWAQRVIATKPAALDHPLGIVALGWGEWIDDGWHASYKGAPKRSGAWTPTSRPELVLGGVLAVWPWQVGGELVLCHAASRDRAGVDSVQAVRFACDLPPR